MTLQDRIKEAIVGSGLTPAEFSRAAKVSQSAINQLADGKTKSLKADTAAHIEITTGYKATWLALGKGQKKVDAAHQEADHPQTNATITPFPATTLDAVMERLSHYLAQVPQSHRKLSSEALAALALQPDDVARQTGILRLLVEPTVRADETATGTDHAQK